MHPATPIHAFPDNAKQNAVMHREEVVGSRSRIVGYRFHCRPLHEGRASAHLHAGLLREEAVDRLAQQRLALIPLAAEDWHEGHFHSFVANNSFFLLQAPLPGANEGRWRTALADIRAAGGKVALPLSSATLPGAAADMLLLDFSAYEWQPFERLVFQIRQRNPQLLLAAENVRSWPEYRFCQSLGIHYALGDFALSRDTEENRSRTLDSSRLVLLEMLNLLRANAEADELAAAAKREPGVILRVLSLVNSPAGGLAKPVTNLAAAIMVLGRDYLYRWLSIALFSINATPRDEALLIRALQRARLLELLAQQQGQSGDDLFLVGALSLADLLLGLPMPELVGRLRLPKDVHDALAHSQGPYAPYLTLALALERGPSVTIGRFSEILGLDAAAINRASAAARAWAEETAQAAPAGNDQLRSVSR